jgi:CheY-like chemotaxis protein
MEAGMDAHITKPLQKEVLMSTIGQLIEVPDQTPVEIEP